MKSNAQAVSTIPLGGSRPRGLVLPSPSAQRRARRRDPILALLTEPKRPLTLKRLDMLMAAWNAWAEAAQTNNDTAYANARSEMHTLVAEYLPELVDLARNTLRGRE